MDKLTVESVRKAVLERIQDLEARKNLFGIIQAELASWEGKVINVRLKNRLRQLLPDYIVLVKKSWYGIQIVAYKGCGMAHSSINYDNPFTFQLTKETTPNQRLREDVYQNLNPSLFGSSGTIFAAVIKLDNFLEVIPEVVERWNQAIDDLENVSAAVPDIYPLTKLFS